MPPARARCPAQPASSSSRIASTCGGVGGVVDGDPPRPHAPRLATRPAARPAPPRSPETTTEPGPLTAATPDAPSPARQQAPHAPRSRQATDDHPAAAGKRGQQPAAQRDDPGGVLQREAARRRGRRRSRPGSGRRRQRAARRRPATARPARPSTANSAGCDHVDPLQRPAPPPPRAARPRATSRRTPPAPRRTRAMRRANTGRRVAAARRPMPAHWEPWPGNTNTVCPPSVRPPHPDRPRVARLPRPAPPSPAEQLARGRRRDDDRAVLERARGAVSESADVARVAAPGVRHRSSRSRAAWPRSASLAAGRRATRQLPQSADARRVAAVAGIELGWAPHPRGASSRITCALVPLIPNEETPARRGRPAARPRRSLGQQRDARRRSSRPAGGLVDVQRARQHAVAQRHHHLDHPGDARRGLGVADVGLDRAQPQRAVAGAALAVGGEQRLRLDRVAERGAGAVRLDRVDVAGASPALASAWRITRCWEGPLGAVRPLLAPSWLTALPRTTRQHRVAVAPGVGEPLQQQHARRPRPSRRRRRPPRRTCSARPAPGRAGG